MLIDIKLSVEYLKDFEKIKVGLVLQILTVGFNGVLGTVWVEEKLLDGMVM